MPVVQEPPAKCRQNSHIHPRPTRHRDLSMCKNDGTPAAMELGKSDTAVAALMSNILSGGDQVRDTSQKEDATGGQGPHTFTSPKYISMNSNAQKLPTRA